MSNSIVLDANLNVDPADLEHKTYWYAKQSVAKCLVAEGLITGVPLYTYLYINRPNPADYKATTEYQKDLFKSNERALIGLVGFMGLILTSAVVMLAAKERVGYAVSGLLGRHDIHEELGRQLEAKKQTQLKVS